MILKQNLREKNNMFIFGFIRGAIFGVSLGLVSGLIAKKICKKKNEVSKNNTNKKKNLNF